MNWKHWRLYLLDDKKARHLLMEQLVASANAEFGRLGLEHTFECGFHPPRPVLDAPALNEALTDRAGIWLVDLAIPQREGVGPIEDIGDPSPLAPHRDLELAYRLIPKLRAIHRFFIVVSSAAMTGGRTVDVERDLGVKGVRFDYKEHTGRVVNALLGLTVPQYVYPRLFGEVIARLADNKYHTDGGTCPGVAMFKAAHNPPVHTLTELDEFYSFSSQNPVGLPSEIREPLEDILPALIRGWNLEPTALAQKRYEVCDRNSYWFLPAAKAINSGKFHRVFFFCLPPARVEEGCNPAARKQLQTRHSAHPALGLLALQNLIKADRPDDGFNVEVLGQWQDGESAGISLRLASKKARCAGQRDFESVLAGNWAPKPDNPESQETLRALDCVRRTFYVGGSAVECKGERILLDLRFEESNLD